MKPEKLNALALSHFVLQQCIKPGAVCIDATAGNGHDTLFLCQRCGSGSHITAMDIQEDAVSKTNALLSENGFQARVVCDSHHHMARYAAERSVDAVVFNLGWLPGGSHDLFTKAETTLPALEAALSLLKPCGLLSLCIYYGRNNGTGEKDAVLEWLKTVDQRIFTVILHEFVNRGKCPAMYACVFRNSDA